MSFQKLKLTKPPTQLVHDYQPSGQSCLYHRITVAAEKPNFHIVVSTGSGTGQAKDVWTKLVQPMIAFVCDAAQRQAEVHFTESETSIADLTRKVFFPQANQGVTQAIVLLSGDGGLVDIVNTLLEEPLSDRYQKPNVSILPLGTGNALAHSAGITSDKTLGLSTLFRGWPQEVPIFTAKFSPGARLLVNEAREERELWNVNGTATAYGAVVCSWGLHAGLVADSDTTEFRKHGAERFQMAAKEALFPSDGSPPHPYKGKLSIRRPGANEFEVVPRETHGYVLATFCSQLEAGFTISPASKPLDGKLRLVHFGHMSGQEAMDLMGKAYAGGGHVEDNRVGYDEIEALRIEFDEEDGRWRRVCIDGKIIRVEEGGWVEVMTGSVRGLVDLIAK